MTLPTPEDRCIVSTLKLRVRERLYTMRANTQWLSPIADPIPIIEAIHERKMKAGVAISPDTPSSAITDEIGELADMLLVMTVYPG